MELTYPLFDLAEAQTLAEFLASEDWHFHAGPHQTLASAHARIASGEFDGDHDRTHWIVRDDERVGMIHIEDLGDGNPLFDLRLRAGHRGRGLGTAAVTWLTAAVFGEFPDLNRIEATTRQDNVAMRRVLVKCGFVKEARYRQEWPSEGGTRYDSIGYGILRSDWGMGVTTAVNWEDGP
ncbi:MAG: GNAT family N-acetyltransferase [Actinomycetia bacterium]|nr:GNAT family N-acetyltransferase [Actinomycetes bacterium]